MKRFIDEEAYTYSFFSVLRRGESIEVACGRCGGLAGIALREGMAEWRCSQCLGRGRELQVFHYSAKGNCDGCMRWFNVQITDEKQTSHKAARVLCPHCGKSNLSQLYRKPAGRWYYRDIRNGRDPIFNMELFYLDYVRGKQVWAVNRPHLNYLIGYISAELRVRRDCVPAKTASHSIPAYMKLAKNRTEVTKVLTRLLNKRSKVFLK